jgi:hypothetical protein
VRLGGGTQLRLAVLGQLRVRDARVGRAGFLAYVAGALEPLQQARDPRGGQHDLLGEVDPPHAAVRGAREVQEHLVVVQRQPMLTLQLRGELARDRGMGAQERDPAVQLTRR